MNKNDICFEKYIYLDWNIVKNMISPRKGSSELDEELKSTIINLKKKYKFPYSHAHIKDRANHYSEEYREAVEKDFLFYEKIVKKIIFGKNLTMKEWLKMVCLSELCISSKQLEMQHLQNLFFLILIKILKILRRNKNTMLILFVNFVILL